MCSDLARRARIGVDTEFERSRTFHPRPALVQITDGETTWLVDPLAVEDCTPLARLLTDPSVLKIVHACSEDVEVLVRLTGAVPCPVLDTQVAAAFAGHGFSPGYQRLVEALLGVRVPKEETRSNWLARPLSPSQLRYAALDAHYLLPLEACLRPQMEDLGRTSWCQEECTMLVEGAARGPDPEAIFQRLRRRASLGSRQLATLRELAAWREAEARAGDLPRRWVADDASLVEMASRPPDTPASLEGVAGLPAATARRRGGGLLEAIARGVQASADAAPDPDPPHDVANRHSRLVKRLGHVTRTRAEALGMPPELLAPRRVLETLVEWAQSPGDTPPPPLDGWRREVITGPLLDALEEQGP